LGALSPVHLIIILVVALLVIGPGKLPETGAALGRAIRDFRQAVDGKEEAAAPGGADPVTPAPSQAAPVTTDGASTDEPRPTGSA
jgi:sec-independent protein translocase protein TatA